MNLRPVTLVATAILTFSANSPTEASWQIPISSFSRFDYAAGTQNWDIDIQRNGWVYFANNYGMVEYDGSRWILYGLSRSSSARAVKITDNGDVYCGGNNEFGMFVDNGEGGLEYKSLSDSLRPSVPDLGDVWQIDVSHDEVYFITHTCVYVHNTSRQEVSKIACPAQINSGCVAADTLFIARQDGIFALKNGRFSGPIANSAEIAQMGIKHVKPFRGGSLLIATTNSGLYVYHDGQIRRQKTEADDYVAKYSLFSIAVNDKYIAQGTIAGGVAITDLDGRDAQYVTTANGLQNNTILSLKFDNSGNLWCGLDNGIDRIEVSSAMSQLYDTQSDFGSGYATLLHGNKLLLGTNRGLFSTPFPQPAGQTTFQANHIKGSVGQVWGLSRLWGHTICSHTNGLFEVTDGGELRTISSRDGFWQVKPLPNDSHTAVACGYEGFYIIRELSGALSLVNKVEGVPTQIKTFEIDKKGRIWACSEKKVVRLELSPDMTRCVSEVIFDQPNGENPWSNVMNFDGHIVISSGNKSYVTDKDGELTNDASILNLLDGPDTFYSCLSKDISGNIWYINGDALKVRPFDPHSGQYAERPLVVWNLPSFYIYGFTDLTPIGNGQAVVTCVQGFALADMHNAANRDQSLHTSLFIRQMSSITPGHEATLYGYSFGKEAPKVEIPYNQNSVRIIYGCTPGETRHLKFTCRLTRDGEELYGVTDESLSKEYTYLSPGEYIFSISTSLSDGSLCEHAEISFTILPPWYMTWWAITLYCLTAASVAGVVTLAVKRHNRQARLKLTKQKEEEMRRKEEAMKQQNLLLDKEILQLRNEKMAADLKAKSQELSTMMLNTISRNELITKIKREVSKAQEDIESKDAALAQKHLAQLQGKLTQAADDKVDWKRFEQNFDIVNDSFMRKLQARFPWIGYNEKKLCVYIVMGLINKEVAPLMGISVRGVEMLRYRLRKKMDLQREDDLLTLLRSIRDGD